MEDQAELVLVATDDRMIPPPAQRLMSDRAGATVVEVAGSHAIYVSQPRAVAALTTPEREVTAGHVRGRVIPDPEVSFVKRFLAAFWRLCEQEIATVTDPADPEVGGTMSTPPEISDVRVVSLRRPTAADRPDTHRVVGWSHRWIVEMHKRNQWYPKQGVHKVIFVGPYIKGPLGLPLKDTAVPVRALVR